MILVTGSNGLIGHALLKRLGDRGIGTDASLGVDVRDREAVDALVARHRPSAIVHAGAISGPMVANDDPAHVFDVNIGGTVNVCEAARQHGAGRVIFLSSINAYGDQPTDKPVLEIAPLLAREAYGASKVAGEAILRAYARAGIDGTSLRLGGVYGPRRTTDCLIRLMLENDIAGRPTELPYGQGWWRQYVFVDDIVGAILLALGKEKLPQDAYNITGGSWQTLDDIARTLKVDARFGPAPHPFDYRVGRLDISAAARDLGYAPKTSLEAGAAIYRDWLKAKKNA